MKPLALPTDCRSTASAPAPDPAPPLAYHYVSSAGGRVERKDEAHVSLEDGRVGFLVRCRREELSASGRSYWPDPSRWGASAGIGVLSRFVMCFGNTGVAKLRP